MNKNIFRPVDFWKSAVMTMPDSSFFELLRCVFGKIKTPFNKQQLLKDLEIFLLREDIQKTIAAFIDENDAKVIAAVALFGEPVMGELESFFYDELSFAQLHDIVVNLEERFILYRFKEENKSRLALNPLLEQALAPVAADISVLFPVVAATAAEAETASAPLLNDRILAGILSFVSQWQPFYRAEGVIRKQVIEAIKNTFPGIDFELVIGGLQILGLLYIDEDKLVPDKKRFCDFGSAKSGGLSARERMEYCAAALLVYNEIKNTTEILPPLYRGRIREISNFIHGFLDLLDTEFLYTEKTLKKLIEVLKARTGENVASDTLLDTLEKTGLVVTVSPQQKRLGVIVHNTAEKNAPVDRPSIAIDSGLSILVYPEINYDDAIKLAAFLSIKEAGAVVRFELDKNSAVRAFDSGINADEIIELLGRLSGCKIDDSFLWNLKDWEKRHGEVSLKKGVVLTLAEDHRYLAATMSLARLIDETPAPGVYLLGENAMEQASAVLKSAGIDIIARRSNKKEDNDFTFSYFPSLSSRALEKIPFAAAPSVAKTSGSSQTAGNAASLIIEEFLTVLKKMPMDKAEHDELSARIKRRLVLCKTQLKDANLRYEKLEARHMDYAGKQNIARQAISQQLPVEIVWPGAGTDKSIFGVPKAIEKENGDLVLVIVCADKDDVMRIPLAKISLLRRIKKSIFET